MHPEKLKYVVLILADFNNPEGAILGILNAIFGFGAVAALPFVAYVNDRFGRRKAIMLGTCSVSWG